jgi:hypothetical protein
MRVLQWFAEELKAVLAATLYFAIWFLIVLLLKRLMLEDYGIEFGDLSMAVILAVVTGKVVVVLRKAPLRQRHGFLEVLLRTALYTLATVVLLVAEKAFSLRDEAGGFAAALSSVFEHADMPRIWATVICVGLAFVGYTSFDVLRREIGGVRIRDAFFARHMPERQ